MTCFRPDGHLTDAALTALPELPFVGLQANWQQIITGIILMLAVGVDMIKNRRLARKR